MAHKPMSDAEVNQAEAIIYMFSERRPLILPLRLYVALDFEFAKRGKKLPPNVTFERPLC